MHMSGQFKREHYKSVYFHNSAAEVDRKFDAYCAAIANAVNAFRKERRVFPILVGHGDARPPACEELESRLDDRAPLFVSDEHDMYDLVSVLRNCTLLVSSRFHAIVTSMPGLVSSVGITMDERIRNLMARPRSPGPVPRGRRSGPRAAHARRCCASSTATPTHSRRHRAHLPAAAS